MSILVYAELKDRNGTKSAFEAVYYAKKASETVGGEVIAVNVGAVNGGGGGGG